MKIVFYFVRAWSSCWLLWTR